MNEVHIALKGYIANQILVTVTSMQGVPLLNQTLSVKDERVSLNLSNLKQGIYIVNITINGERKGYRIFKN